MPRRPPGLKLELPGAGSPADPVPSPMRRLQGQLGKYEGQDRERLEEFIFNKSRLLSASELHDSSFERLSHIASGLGRDVYKVRHTHTALLLCQKVVHVAGKEAERVMLKRELQLLDECHCPQIVLFYGSYISDKELCILMEFMDGGCLSNVLERVGRVDEAPLAAVSYRIIQGLEYLEQNRMVHRDMKPHNVLVNTKGEVKLCDFGVSQKISTNRKRLHTFVGTMRYMAPERLCGNDYTGACDIWSVGISLIECATGHYPMPGVAELPPVPYRQPTIPGAGSEGHEGGGGAGAGAGEKEESVDKIDRVKAKEAEESHPEMQASVFEMVSLVVDGPSPRLPAGYFSSNFESFVADCLQKDPSHRPPLADLLRHEWILGGASRVDSLAKWVRSTMATRKHNKSRSGTFSGNGESSGEVASAAAAAAATAAAATTTTTAAAYGINGEESFVYEEESSSEEEEFESVRSVVLADDGSLTDTLSKGLGIQ